MDVQRKTSAQRDAIYRSWLQRGGPELPSGLKWDLQERTPYVTLNRQFFFPEEYILFLATWQKLDPARLIN